MAKQGYWSFRCPECGISDEELGGLLDDHELFCIMCLEAGGVLIRLQRWLLVDDTADRDHPPAGPMA